MTTRATDALRRLSDYVATIRRHNDLGPGPHYGDVVHGLNDHALLRSDVDVVTRALREVLEIHRPSTIDGQPTRPGMPVYCLGCHDAAQRVLLPLWPCPTAKALGEHSPQPTHL